MFNNLREASLPRDVAGDGTNPISPADAATDLTPRQVAAVRLLVLGRSGRAVARGIGVEEHTISRWRRIPAFRDEILRQQELALALQLGGAGRFA